MRPPTPPAARLPLLRLAALALAVAPVLGCTSTPAPAPDASVVGEPAGAAATSSPVAELQAGLSALLVERVYVVALATDVLAGGAATREAQGALEALEGSSTALADLLGATYSEARGPLLEALRREDAALARHALALAAGDEAGAAQARRELVGAQDDLARVLRQVVPTLDAPELAERLGADLRAQLASASYEELHEAAQEATETARVLAAGIATDRDLGSSSTEAVRLRADLTAQLTEHVALAAALVREQRDPGPGAASVRAALDSNAQLLAGTLGDRYAAAQGAFLRSWTQHLDRLQRYGAARAAGGTGEAERGLVTAYPAELARLLAESIRGLPARSAQAELEPALAGQLAAMERAAAGDAASLPALRSAVAATLPAAALLSAAVAQDLRLS